MAGCHRGWVRGIGLLAPVTTSDLTIVGRRGGVARSARLRSPTVWPTPMPPVLPSTMTPFIATSHRGLFIKVGIMRSAGPSAVRPDTE